MQLFAITNPKNLCILEKNIYLEDKYAIAILNCQVEKQSFQYIFL